MRDSSTRKKPESLEIDSNFVEEHRAKEADYKNERAASVSHEAMRRLANQELMAKAVRETSEAKINWHQVRWAALRFLLFMLVGYFLLSACFDFVNFLEGVKILSVGLRQIAVMAVLYVITAKLRDRLTEEQLTTASAKAMKVGKVAWIAAMTYAAISGIRGFSSIMGHRGKHGFHWNYAFLYFLCFFAVAGAISFWLALQRKKALEALHEIDFGDSLPEVSRDQLYLIKYASEGMIFNLVLMLLLQFTFGVDVPSGLFHALASPGIFLFCFFPFFAFVFLRKFFGSF
ncbi:MAG: hypothetical protein ACXWQO_08575 [Bdellovibrionota bacterium]